MSTDIVTTLFVCILGLATDTYTPGDCVPKKEYPGVAEYNRKQEELTKEKQETINVQPAPESVNYNEGN